METHSVLQDSIRFECATHMHTLSYTRTFTHTYSFTPTHSTLSHSHTLTHTRLGRPQFDDRLRSAPRLRIVILWRLNSTDCAHWYPAKTQHHHGMEREEGFAGTPVGASCEAYESFAIICNNLLATFIGSPSNAGSSTQGSLCLTVCPSLCPPLSAPVCSMRVHWNEKFNFHNTRKQCNALPLPLSLFLSAALVVHFCNGNWKYFPGLTIFALLRPHVCPSVCPSVWLSVCLVAVRLCTIITVSIAWRSHAYTHTHTNTHFHISMALFWSKNE